MKPTLNFAYNQRSTKMNNKSVLPKLSEENSATLKAYDKRVFEYIKGTPQQYKLQNDPLLHWIDAALSLIPKGSKVLEIGSATPRDARYIRSRSFQIQCSDAARGFVEYLKTQGEDALLLNAVTDQFPSGYRMIIAAAVVPHLTETDFRQMLSRTNKALPSQGVFAFTVKNGTGEKWINEKLDLKRFTKYWQSIELCRILEEFEFKIQYIHTGEDPFIGERWHNIVAQKSA